MDDFYIPGETSDWQKTVLWKQLNQSEEAEANSVRTTLNVCMPQIQKVLAQGGTSSSDFTLHDSGHAFRVARRMAQIIPADVLPQLSTYELALLLLSAYLHDIGMTPERRKVTLHHQYLLTGEPQELSQDERNEFQEWLDNEGRGIVPPLSQERSTIETLRLADEIITYYCRHRHNDWSEEWIRKNLASLKLGTYVYWIDDLVELCRSHHYGYQELIKNKFNPKPLNEPGKVVHLRYLACVLRVADILEFDPERTPEVILRHRDISSGSLIYWYKDSYITLFQTGKRLVLNSTPPRAHIHRAIEITADQIDEELWLCRALADETHFSKCPGLDEDLPHRWDLPSSVHRNISEKEGEYEYINGAFRPDTDKLLKLLYAGELYSTPLAAVRELLQNAFDAVREHIAYERLMDSNRQNLEMPDSLIKRHNVELTLRKSKDEVWLICADTGVGMTKAIIRNHLLVSGTARRHDILDLERRCKKAGFSLGRTGQFGIGVLSYFMLANKVVIKSRRAQEAGDAEATGWRFETEGVGSFGELRQNKTFLRGTEVHLRIRPEIISGNPTAWFEELRNYLKGLLFHIPCKFQFTSDPPEYEGLSLRPGWILTEEDISNQLTDEIQEIEDPDNELSTELTSKSIQQQRKAKEDELKKLKNEVKQRLQWKLYEGDLPDDLGRFRIHLPYFKLPGGASLVFLRIRKNGSQLFLKDIKADYSGYLPDPHLEMGWKGMKVRTSGSSHQLLNKLKVFGEIDWNSANTGKLSVNRDELTLTDAAQKAIVWLEQRFNDMYYPFLQENKDSPYSYLGYRIINCELPFRGTLRWVSEEPSESSNKRWDTLRSPSTYIDFIDPIDYPMPQGCGLAWKGKQIFITSKFDFRTSRDSDSTSLNWPLPIFPPDRIVGFNTSFGIRAAPLWVQKPKEKPIYLAGPVSHFPPKWPNLIGASMRRYTSESSATHIWNAQHPILKAIDSAGWEWMLESFKDMHDPLLVKNDLLNVKSRSASWVIRCLQKNQRELWNGLKDRDPSFLKDLWAVLFGSNVKSREETVTPICLLREKSIDIMSSDGWLSYGRHSGNFTKYTEYLKQYMPDPGPEWTLEVVSNNPKPVAKKVSKSASKAKKKSRSRK